MSFFNNLFISIFNKKIAEDFYGNKFYESKNTDYLGRKKRYVIYNGLDEPSKVPPMWHAWLHHLSDQIVTKDAKFSWQQRHKPNLTGTNLAFNPAFNKETGLLKAENASKYNKWQPK